MIGSSTRKTCLILDKYSLELSSISSMALQNVATNPRLRALQRLPKPFKEATAKESPPPFVRRGFFYGLADYADLPTTQRLALAMEQTPPINNPFGLVGRARPDRYAPKPRTGFLAAKSDGLYLLSRTRCRQSQREKSRTPFDAGFPRETSTALAGVTPLVHKVSLLGMDRHAKRL